MNVIGSLKQRGDSYLTKALWATEDLQLWLEKDGDEDPSKVLLFFWNILEDMQLEETQLHPAESGDRLDYRSLVWGILAETANVYPQTHKGTAKRLQEAMQKTRIYHILSKEVKAFTDRLGKFGIGVSMSTIGSEMVCLLVDTKQAGETEKAFLWVFVAGIQKKLTEQIEAQAGQGS